MLASTDYLFPLLEIFLVLRITSGFLLRPGHLCSILWDYGSYLNLFFLFFLKLASSDTVLAEEGESLPPYWQVEVEVQVLHLGSLDPGVAHHCHARIIGSPLTPAWLGEVPCYCSLNGLHWCWVSMHSVGWPIFHWPHPRKGLRVSCYNLLRVEI